MDLAARRREFPALERTVHGQRLAYLDSAATTLLPRAVIDAVAEALISVGNPGRGAHTRAAAATELVETARHDIAGFLGARASDIAFTSGTTAAVNLVADAWGRAHVKAGDVVIASELEHHANYLPWQRLCERTGARFLVAPVDATGRIAVDELRALITAHRPALVALAHVSNVTGAIAPVREIAAAAREVGAVTFVDGAQAVAHLPVDVGELACDFYAFSGHKLYGPPGVGVLWARDLHALSPWQLGGGMVASVVDGTFREAPARHEAGTPNTPAIAGLAAAIRWLREHADARDHEPAMHALVCDAIRNAGARILGVPVCGVVAFTWEFHPHDTATIADGEGVALRSGHHCAQPIHARFGVPASTRASIGCYTGTDDVEQLSRALAKVREVLGR